MRQGNLKQGSRIAAKFNFPNFSENNRGSTDFNNAVLIGSFWWPHRPSLPWRNFFSARLFGHHHRNWNEVWKEVWCSREIKRVVSEYQRASRPVGSHYRIKPLKVTEIFAIIELREIVLLIRGRTLCLSLYAQCNGRVKFVKLFQVNQHNFTNTHAVCKCRPLLPSHYPLFGR